MSSTTGTPAGPAQQPYAAAAAGTAVVDALAPPASPAQPATVRAARRRAWLLAAVAGLLALVYLTWWAAYVAVQTEERYRQLAPGATATRAGAEFRLLSLVQSGRLTDSGGGRPQIADAGTTFVVARLEVVTPQPDVLSLCGTALLGPDGRVWTGSGAQVERAVPTCLAADVVPGRPHRFEVVYVVPTAYADRILGVALPDSSTAERASVLRPPA